MIFSELYGAYYNTVAVILTEAIAHPRLISFFQTYFW